MLKEYDEMDKNHMVTKERCLWNIARELSRRNDLLEIEMLCKTAEAIKSAAKGSLTNLHEEGWSMAEELALMAHKKITKICGLPGALNQEDNDEEEG